MTLAEFKAWFEGYTDAIEGAPTKAQFDKIKTKVGALSATVAMPRMSQSSQQAVSQSYLDQINNGYVSNLGSLK